MSDTPRDETAIRADYDQAKRSPMKRWDTASFNGFFDAYRAEPATSHAISRLVTDIPSLLAELSAVRAERDALNMQYERGYADGLRDAIKEVHREAGWQYDQTRRHQILSSMPLPDAIQRLLELEKLLRTMEANIRGVVALSKGHSDTEANE